MLSETRVQIAIGGDRLQGRSAQVDIDGPREPKIARVGEIAAGAVATIEAAGDEAIVDRKPIVGRIGVRVRAGERREAARARATGAAKARNGRAASGEQGGQ